MAKRWSDRAAVAFVPIEIENDRLAITNFKAWRLKEPVSGRRYTVVKLESRGGAAGYGEGGECAREEVLSAKSAIAGKRATDAEWIRHHLSNTPAMEAAVNNAMLDLAARSADVPVYQFLGGPTRFKARVVAHLEGEDEDSLAHSLTHAAELGYRAFAFPVPARDSMWRMQAYVDAIRARFDRLKGAGGPDADFVLDGKAMLTPGDASFIATAFERSHLLWFDEPTSVLTNDALSRISDESVTPVGFGRGVHDVATFQNLLRWGCVDILAPESRPEQHPTDPTHGGCRGNALCCGWSLSCGWSDWNLRCHSSGGQSAEFFCAASSDSDGCARSLDARGADAECKRNGCGRVCSVNE